MRYSFHGKVRATGQQVDGFVEAANASQAIDRLADRGIIGVYSVRPEPKIPKNSVILSGEAEPEEPVERPRLERTERSHRPRPIPAVAAPVAPVQQQLPAPQPAPVPAPGTETVLTQLVEKVSTLLVQVERLLSRPQQVIYQSGPVRSGGQGGKKTSRMPNDAQTSTLRDIFQSNLDLRQSLEKLASTVGPAAPRTNGEAASKPPRESVPNGRDLIQAQPAA